MRTRHYASPDYPADAQLRLDAINNRAAVIRRIAIALRAWEGLARRPRSPQAWMYCACLLRDVREDAVKLGVLDRRSDSYTFLNDRYRDAEGRRSFGRLLEERGDIDVRL